MYLMKKAIVIGSGHAGCEACLALARMGIDTTLLTLNLDSIAYLACNPSIGGTAKGHLVCEIDALGGQMGINTDQTLIQIRMLNRSKGVAVQSLRAQADKRRYHEQMKHTLERQKNLKIRQAEASEIVVSGGKVIGVKTAQGNFYEADGVVVCTGVYLASRIITGQYIKDCGPNGFANAHALSRSLEALGFELRRFKTGTPARVHADSINFDKCQVQYGEDDVQNFSFLTTKKPKNVGVCYLTYTTEKTKQIILDNISSCPMISGEITGVGPRYCPSIESKIIRFADKERHQVFLEPETQSSKEVYVQGMSTSMGTEVQEQMYHSIIGLENCDIMRDAYAIEYDCIDSTTLYPTLESKLVEGLYFAGQINGSSGYEEAGAQGIVAGINCALKLKGENPLILKRSESYIGVLIDDLVTKGTNEPYRMMTSRSEYRLNLRQDNADLRLTPYGVEVGLVSSKRKKMFDKKLEQLSRAKEELKKTFSPSAVEALFTERGENLAKSGISLLQIIRRNNISAKDTKEKLGCFEGIDDSVLNVLTTEVKYEGYINKESELRKEIQKQENVSLKPDFDYSVIKGLRLEAIDKLNEIKPLSLAQASRISGVNPADIAVLMVYLKQNNDK